VSAPAGESGLNSTKTSRSVVTKPSNLECGLSPSVGGDIATRAVSTGVRPNLAHVIADFAVVQRIPDQPLKRSSQQRTGRAHPRVVSTTDGRTDDSATESKKEDGDHGAAGALVPVA
jgi:hypothetical protein